MGGVVNSLSHGFDEEVLAFYHTRIQHESVSSKLSGDVSQPMMFWLDDICPVSPLMCSIESCDCDVQPACRIVGRQQSVFARHQEVLSFIAREAESASMQIEPCKTLPELASSCTRGTSSRSAMKVSTTMHRAANEAMPKLVAASPAEG